MGSSASATELHFKMHVGLFNSLLSNYYKGPIEQMSSAWTRELEALAAPLGHILAYSLISVLTNSLLWFCFSSYRPHFSRPPGPCFLADMVYFPCSSLSTLITKHLDPATHHFCSEFQLNVQASAHVYHVQLDFSLLQPPFSFSRVSPWLPSFSVHTSQSTHQIAFQLHMCFPPSPDWASRADLFHHCFHDEGGAVLVQCRQSLLTHAARRLFLPRLLPIVFPVQVLAGNRWYSHIGLLGRFSKDYLEGFLKVIYPCMGIV